MTDVRNALDGARQYLTEHPDEAVYTDSVARARLEEGLRVVVEGPAGESVTTDMPASVGGGGEDPSPGWLFRAALASCVATLVALRAAEDDVTLAGVSVEVDSRSDDRGILAMDPSTPAGPLSVRIHVAIDAPGVEGERLERIAREAAARCPVYDAVIRGVEVSLEV